MTNLNATLAAHTKIVIFRPDPTQSNPQMGPTHDQLWIETAAAL